MIADINLADLFVFASGIIIGRVIERRAAAKRAAKKGGGA